MADDIVNRLLWWADKRVAPKSMPTLVTDCREAADEITALRKRCAELEAALKPFVYNAVSVQESTKLIQKSCGDMVPVSLSVTKAQFLVLLSLIQEQKKDG